MTKKSGTPPTSAGPPPPHPGTGKPPKPQPNEINLTELIDEYIEANKNGKHG